MARFTRTLLFITSAALALGAGALHRGAPAPSPAARLAPAVTAIAAAAAQEHRRADAAKQAPRADAAEDARAAKLQRAPRFVPVSGAGPANAYRAEALGERLAALLAAATVELSPEEQALLEEAGEDGLRGLIARTEHDFLNASEADRPEKQRRYTMALNLVPKLDPAPEAEARPEIRAPQEAYLKAVAREQRAWARLDEAERTAARDALKRRFLSSSESKEH